MRQGDQFLSAPYIDPSILTVLSHSWVDWANPGSCNGKANVILLSYASSIKKKKVESDKWQLHILLFQWAAYTQVLTRFPFRVCAYHLYLWIFSTNQSISRNKISNPPLKNHSLLVKTYLLAHRITSLSRLVNRAAISFLVKNLRTWRIG